MSTASTEKLPEVVQMPGNVVGQPLSNRELTQLLIKHYGVQEGHCELLVEFMIGSGNMGPTSETYAPTAFVSFSKVGLVKTPNPTPMSVDASSVNPAKTSKPRKKS